MAKANKKAVHAKQMNANFDQMISVLDEMATGTEEIMPLFSSSMELSIKILRTYKKAFAAGIKYAQ